MKKMIYVSLLFFLILSGCSNEATETLPDKKPKKQTEKVTEGSEQMEHLYRGNGIIVEKIGNWVKAGEKEDESFHVWFENGHAKSIVSKISDVKTNDEIKKELIAASGDITIIEEKGDALSFKSNRKESIRSDIYIKKGENATYIITFMMPNDQFNQKIVHEFLQKTNLK